MGGIIIGNAQDASTQPRERDARQWRQAGECMYVHSLSMCMYVQGSPLARCDVNRSVTQALLYPKETTDKPNKDTVQNAWLVVHNPGSTLKPRKVWETIESSGDSDTERGH